MFAMTDDRPPSRHFLQICTKSYKVDFESVKDLPSVLRNLQNLKKLKSAKQNPLILVKNKREMIKIAQLMYFKISRNL